MFSLMMHCIGNVVHVLSLITLFFSSVPVHRSTTIYLADRRYDMLPAVLSANLCSLHSRVDRSAQFVLGLWDSHMTHCHMIIT